MKNLLGMFTDVKHKNISSMLEALVNKEVDVVIMDTLSLAPLNETIKKMNLKVAELIDTKSGYGIVLGGIARDLREDIKSALLNKEDMLTRFAENMKENLPVSSYTSYMILNCLINRRH